MRSNRTTFIWLAMLATTAALAALIGYEKDAIAPDLDPGKYLIWFRRAIRE
jgi:hypothetical protein